MHTLWKNGVGMRVSEVLKYIPPSYAATADSMESTHTSTLHLYVQADMIVSEVVLGCALILAVGQY